MISNAKLISLKTQSGATGLGEPALGDELVTHLVPVELINPKAYRVETDRQRDIRNDAMIWINRSMLDVIGHEAQVGDRLVIKPNTLNAAGTEYDVTDVNPRGNGNVLELTLAVRDDNAGGA